jgi:hypothetical protein
MVLEDKFCIDKVDSEREVYMLEFCTTYCATLHRSAEEQTVMILGLRF